MGIAGWTYNGSRMEEGRIGNNMAPGNIYYFKSNNDDLERMRVLMEEAKQHTQVVEVKTHMVPGMFIGLAAGALIGAVAFGKMQFGAGIGMLIGLIAGLCIHKKPKQK